MRRCEEVVGALSRFSLVTRAPISSGPVPCFSMHRLLQSCILDELPDQAVGALLTAACTGVCAGATACWDDREREWTKAADATELWCRHGVHLADLPRGAALLDAALGTPSPSGAELVAAMGELTARTSVCLEELGSLPTAQSLAAYHLRLMRTLHGPGDSPEVAAALNSLAQVHLNLGQAPGQPSMARPMFEEALAMLRRLWGDADHWDLVLALNNVAQGVQADGDYEGAQPLFEQALAMVRRLAGPGDHKDTAKGLSNLAYIHLRLGRYEVAQVMYQECLDMHRRLFGNRDRVFLATAVGNLAEASRYLGDYETSLTLHQVLLRCICRCIAVLSFQSVSHACAQPCPCVPSARAFGVPHPLVHPLCPRLMLPLAHAGGPWYAT